MSQGNITLTFLQIMLAVDYDRRGRTTDSGRAGNNWRESMFVRTCVYGLCSFEAVKQMWRCMCVSLP